MRILPLHEHHYVVMTNLELRAEETNTIYIFEPCIGIDLLPRETVEAIFLELCIAQEEMHLILSLVCKRWSEIVNKNFRDRVHIAWVDREFNANNWNEEIKRKYRVLFTVLKCLNCNRNFKPEIG